jgi:glycosyltransferase involved in cell wall biosynthesis
LGERDDTHGVRAVDRGRSARILMVVNVEWYFWSHRLALARALRDRGYEVIVAAGVERDRQSAIERDGFRFIPIGITRGDLRVSSEVKTFLALCRLYRAERPDLVYQTTIRPILYGSLAARLARIPRVLNAVPGLGYSFTARGFRAAIRRPAVAAAYRFALAGERTRVVFQTHDDLCRFVALGLVKPDRARVIRGSGVDIRAFAPTPEPDGPPIVLLASRLLWDKGVSEFVDAARRLRERSVSCRMVIVGTPDVNSPNAVPSAVLETWHNSGDVEWWGLRSDMGDVLSQSAIVTLPSYYGEGVPKILLEAAAAGRPIVTTDWPGCRDVVQHGGNGLLVQPRDPEGLADALERLLRNPGERAAMGARGRTLAEQEFEEGLVVGQVADLCADMLAPSPGGARALSQ